MKIAITGATGLIGRALTAALSARGDAIVPIGRGVATAAMLAGCEAVVNLAGEPLLGRRWTGRRREVLRSSRIERTAQVVAALERMQPRPRVLVSASAVGYYGDRGAELLSEASPPGEDFLAQLCRDWEAAAVAAEALGIRVVLVRTGMVLAPRGGALAQMLPPFRWGLGGPAGSGRQYWPWIHIEDEVGVILEALGNGQLHGPVNAVAPEAVISRDFARALGRALHRPAVLPLPALALRLVFGGAAAVLLSSQRVAPGKLADCGYRFRFPALASALQDCIASAA
ncbi:MAG TPA: TIGR01777 family oxidoreductase [Terriglobales bacterium]|jgi:hypothetical protein